MHHVEPWSRVFTTLTITLLVRLAQQGRDGYHKFVRLGRKPSQLPRNSALLFSHFVMIQGWAAAHTAWRQTVRPIMRHRSLNPTHCTATLGIFLGRFHYALFVSKISRDKLWNTQTLADLIAQSFQWAVSSSFSQLLWLGSIILVQVKTCKNPLQKMAVHNRRFYPRGTRLSLLYDANYL
jgi:hypothetical protein